MEWALSRNLCVGKPGYSHFIRQPLFLVPIVLQILVMTQDNLQLL